MHHNSHRQLYLNVNASRKFEFEAIVYHVKKDKSAFDKENVKLILFLSKCLSSTESRYWLTELKIVELIWVTKRIHHMIAAFNKTQSFRKSQIKIFTNHSVITSIVKQTKLSFSNIDKLNLRLMRASTYLSQFNMNVQHKSKKLHVIFDALLRLFNYASLSKSRSILNDSYYLNLDSIHYVFDMTWELSFEISWH